MRTTPGRCAWPPPHTYRNHHTFNHSHHPEELMADHSDEPP